MNDAQGKAMLAVIEPLLSHDRMILRQKSIALKQSDGEGWAIGEMLERAVLLLDAWGQTGGLPQFKEPDVS